MLEMRDSNFYQQLSLLVGVFKQLSDPRKRRGEYSVESVTPIKYASVQNLIQPTNQC
jgi:hypothetical protein